jgi:hypothetical protein
MPAYVVAALAAALLCAAALLVADLWWRMVRVPATAALLAGAGACLVGLGVVASAHASQADLGPQAARIQLLVVLAALMTAGILAFAVAAPRRLDRRGVPVRHAGARGRLDALMAMSLGAGVIAPIGWAGVAAVAQEAYLKASALPWAYAGAFAVVAVALAYGALRLEAVLAAGRYITHASALALWAAFIVLATSTLIARLDAVVSRIAHDVVHALIVLLVIPDHPYLETGTWNLIGLFFRKEAGLALTLGLFGALALAQALVLLAKALPVFASEPSAAERRRRRSLVRGARRRQAALSITAVVLLVAAGGVAYASGSTTYDPTPEPLAAKGSAFEIPLSGIQATRMSKYAVSFDGTDFRLDAVRRPDGKVVVTLDACVVCAPQGYSQLGGDLFCKYCGTPIPIMTVGQAGGCNPVPLDSTVTGDKVTVDAAKAVSTWRETTKGK